MNYTIELQPGVWLTKKDGVFAKVTSKADAFRFSSYLGARYSVMWARQYFREKFPNARMLCFYTRTIKGQEVQLERVEVDWAKKRTEYRPSFYPEYKPSGTIASTP